MDSDSARRGRLREADGYLVARSHKNAFTGGNLNIPQTRHVAVRPAEVGCEGGEIGAVHIRVQIKVPFTGRGLAAVRPTEVP